MNETPTIDPRPASSPTPPPAKPNSKLPWILLVVLALVLGGIIIWLVMQLQSSNSKLSSTESDLATAKSASASDADSATEPDNSTSSDAPVTNDNDQDTVVNTTIAWITAQKGGDKEKVTVSVTKKELPFARVAVAAEEGGYACVLKKSNDIWLIVFCGQDSPLQDELDRWGVPTSMLSS